MPNVDLGYLTRRSPREAWVHEASEFTPWLREHAALLGEAVGLELDVEVRQEVAVGPFSADLVGRDTASGSRVLVENQLEQTDHRHLGQLLTYAGGLETDILIWVAARIQEEHRQALTWLNEQTREGTSFFGVEIELLRIDDSRCAPHFKVVVQPNEWQKSASHASTRGPSERGERYRAFWKQLIPELLRLDPAATTASPDRAPAGNWYVLPTGRAGFGVGFVFGVDGPQPVARIELYIDVGDHLLNKAAFDELDGDREALEGEYQEPLRWDRRDDIRASRIFITRPGSIDADEGALKDLRDWGAERMIKLRDVFRSRVQKLDLSLPVAEAPPMAQSDAPAGRSADEGA